MTYVPMTESEVGDIYHQWFIAKYGYEAHAIDSYAWESHFEQAVIARFDSQMDTVLQVLKDFGSDDDGCTANLILKEIHKRSANAKEST
jgi:hypothetical protein